MASRKYRMKRLLLFVVLVTWEGLQYTAGPCYRIDPHTVNTTCEEKWTPLKTLFYTPEEARAFKANATKDKTRNWKFKHVPDDYTIAQ